ncbi:MAG: NUDIX domain-containing protein [Candidatus Omnitrophica bacterium]|nr:NUDIX domain-containing protein [Candidatus Omnitrophota bacterium]
MEGTRMKKEMEIVAALIGHQGKILLCQRNPEDHYGLLWEFPGGKVEPEETLTAAIEREIEEELDIEIKAEDLIGEFTDENPFLKITVSLFRCRIKKGRPRTKDCHALRFLSLSEAGTMDLAPVDRKILAALTSAADHSPRRRSSK